MSGQVIHGDADELVPEASVSKLVQKLSNQREITIDYRKVPAANHFFTDKTAELVAVIESYLAAAPSMKGKEAFLRENIALYIDYVYKGQAVPGAMDRGRLAQVQKFYVSQGIVAKESPLDDLYTNQFVQQ